MVMNHSRINTFPTLKEVRRTLLANSKVKATYDELADEYRLADELIKARIDRQLTQAQLAAKTGMKQAAIARLESGTANPTYETIVRIAKALNKKFALV